MTAYLALWLLNKKTIGGCVRSSQGLSDIFKQGGNYSWVHLRSSHEEAQEVYWEVLLDRQRLSALQFADDFANSIFGWSVAQHGFSILGEHARSAWRGGRQSEISTLKGKLQLFVR